MECPRCQADNSETKLLLTFLQSEWGNLIIKNEVRNLATEHVGRTHAVSLDYAGGNTMRNLGPRQKIIKHLACLLARLLRCVHRHISTNMHGRTRLVYEPKFCAILCNYFLPRPLTAAVLVLVAISFLWGCYESEVPLSKKPSSKVDMKLIGSWRTIPRNDNNRAISLLLKQFNENEYLVAWKEGKDGKTLVARGFITEIRNTHIINLQNIESLDKKERTYVFFKYGFNEKGNLVVNVLSDDFAKLKRKKFKSAKDFYDFVQENIAQNGLFGDSIEFGSTGHIRFEINP
jgi:hypothetical protein